MSNENVERNWVISVDGIPDSVYPTEAEAEARAKELRDEIARIGAGMTVKIDATVQ